MADVRIRFIAPGAKGSDATYLVVEIVTELKKELLGAYVNIAI
jgi:hypothetical protein